MGKKKNIWRSNSFRSMLGFTLIELLIVITVLGVLAGIILIVINPAKQMAKAKDSAKKTTVSQLADALQSYQALNNGTYPAASDAWIGTLVASGDLKSVPTAGDTSCPSSASNQNGYCYKTNAGQTEAVVYTLLESSGIIECAPDCTPYFVWASADNASGIFPLAEGEGDIPGTSGFIFGPSATLTQGLVGWWKMDGNADDSSGNGNDGGLRNGPAWTTEKKYGSAALDLDGLNDCVGITSNSQLKYTGGNMSLTAWIYPDAAETTNGHIFSKPWNGNGQYNIRIVYNYDQTISFFLFGNHQYGATTPITAIASREAWHHIAVTVNSARLMKIYIDGVEKQSVMHDIISWVPGDFNGDGVDDNADDLFYDENLPLSIGTLYPYPEGWAGNNGYSFDGKIDEARIYSRVLSPGEIAILAE